MRLQEATARSLLAPWPALPRLCRTKLEADHMALNRDTIRVSQDTVGQVPMSPPGWLPTPDVLDPGSDDAPTPRADG
jgi:hypothetical protein